MRGCPLATQRHSRKLSYSSYCDEPSALWKRHWTLKQDTKLHLQYCDVRSVLVYYLFRDIRDPIYDVYALELC